MNENPVLSSNKLHTIPTLSPISGFGVELEKLVLRFRDLTEIETEISWNDINPTSERYSIFRGKSGQLSCIIPIISSKKNSGNIHLSCFAFPSEETDERNIGDDNPGFPTNGPCPTTPNIEPTKPTIIISKRRFTAALSLLREAIDNLYRSQSELIPPDKEAHRDDLSDSTSALPVNARKRAERLFDELYKQTGYSRLSLQYISEDTKGRRILVWGRGIEKDSISQWLLRPVANDSLIQGIVNSRTPLIIPDTTNTLHPWAPSQETNGIRSWIGIPVVTEERVSGLITLDHQEAGKFGMELKSTLEEFTSRYKNIFEWIFSQYVVGRIAHHSTIIENLLAALGEPIDSSLVLHTIVEQVAKHLKCSHCTIYIEAQTSTGPELISKATYGEMASPTIRRFPLDKGGLAVKVFKKEEAELWEDATEDSQFISAASNIESPRSIVIAPVKSAGKTIGVICADQDAYGWFNEYDKKLLETIGMQAGIPLRRSEAITTLHDITDQMVKLYEQPEFPEREAMEGKILRKILEGAILLTNASTGVIYKVSSKLLRVENEYAPPGYSYPKPRMEDPKGLTRTIIATKKTLPIEDVKSHPLPADTLKKEFDSIIVLPLKIVEADGSELVIGVLFVDHKQRHKFSPAEITFLEVLCGQGATAIRNAEMIRNLRKVGSQRKQLALHIGELHNLTFEETISRIGKTIIELFGSSVSPTVDLYDAKNCSFEKCYAFGNLKKHLTMKPRTKGGTGHFVAESREPIFYENTKVIDSKKPSIREELVDMKIVSFAALPLMASDEVIAVLYINSEAPLEFDSETRTILEIFTSHASIALENAQLYEALSKSSERKSQYLNLFSHELTQPIQLVQRELPKLYDPQSTFSASERERTWKQVLANTTEQHAIMENLIGLMRAHAGSRTITKKNTLLSNVVRDAIGLCDHFCERSGIGVEPSIPADIRFPMDGQMIKRAMINLLNNAITHSKQGGTVQIKAKRDAGHVIIEVSNEGERPPRNLRNRILKGYIKPPNKVRKKGQGLGIGLQVTKFLLSLHNGELDFDDNSGKGATFRATIPISSGDNR